ncbi:MAG TPA: hypothetical protein VMU86_01595 [Steroidobacteraceae bacterium]|nr:hypothetical protein [Steroidobacteraceae bacterium]
MAKRSAANRRTPARTRAARGWRREALYAVGWVAFGAIGLPILIYLCGITLLGRYPGASLGRTFSALWLGLGAPSAASWVVVLGPYALILLLRLLRLGWTFAKS